MAFEIERKFLVDKELLDPHLIDGEYIEQGYLDTNGNTSVRIRITPREAFITVKGGISNTTRSEFEYPIPRDEGLAMIDMLCENVIIMKTRYHITHGEHVWDVDVFHGQHQGLIVAEIELTSEDEEFDLPEWTTTEVTDDMSYLNCNLIKKSKAA